MIEVLPLAMVGGGPGSFIGPVHRMAAELDGRMRLVAGVFSSDPERSRAAAAAYAIDPTRVYPDYPTMFESERARADGVQVVSIATPNHLHLPIATAALASGVHVVSDKPATATLKEALALREAVRASDRVYALTYTYSGYPMIRRARDIVAAGELGPIRKIVVEYPQGWLSAAIERGGNRQAAWRVDPVQAGVGGCIGDIGVHAFHLAEYVSGERVSAFVADLRTMVPGRALDDDCNVLLRFAGGASGVLVASQVATGERNNLTLRIYGERKGLRWCHERADRLTLTTASGDTSVLHAGQGTDGAMFRLPPGHPEGFIEAFARIYADVAAAIAGKRELIGGVVPGIAAGVRSMRFVETAVAASHAGHGWTSFEEDAS